MQIRARILNRVLFELYLFPVSLKRAMMKVTMGKIAAILCTRVTFNRDEKNILFYNLHEQVSNKLLQTIQKYCNFNSHAIQLPPFVLTRNI